MEVDAGVRARRRHDVYLKFEVLEVVMLDWPYVVKVRTGTMDHDHPVLYAEGTLLVAGLPPIQRLAVEQGKPTLRTDATLGTGEINAGKAPAKSRNPKRLHKLSPSHTASMKLSEFCSRFQNRMGKHAERREAWTEKSPRLGKNAHRGYQCGCSHDEFPFSIHRGLTRLNDTMTQR